MESDTPCCRGECRQGRDCPLQLQARREAEVVVSILVCALFLLLAVLGAAVLGHGQ